jgi:hypothetical protein
VFKADLADEALKASGDELRAMVRDNPGLVTRTCPSATLDDGLAIGLGHVLLC